MRCKVHLKEGPGPLCVLIALKVQGVCLVVVNTPRGAP